MIITPDILPNNMQSLRIMKGKSTEETSETLQLNRSYISSLENSKANMSGTTTIKVMDFLDVNFQQLYERDEVATLDYTQEILTSHKIQILTDSSNIIHFTNKEGLIPATKLVEDEINHLNIEGKIKEFEYLGYEEIKGSEKVGINVKVIVTEEIVMKKDFDLNLTSDINLDLLKKLLLKGYNKSENIIITQYKKNDNIIYLNNHYNIVNEDTIINTNKISVDSNVYEIVSDESNEEKSLKLKVQTEELFNFKYIEDYLGLTKEDTAKAIGVTANGYESILQGNQRLSTKIMWRLVKFYKVPLENIINIELYKKHFNIV